MDKYLSLIIFKWKGVGFQRYFRNISWMFLTRLFTMVVSLSATLYIARRLGPVNFGELDYAIATIGLFGWIGGWGIDTILNRELINKPENRNQLTGTAVILRLFFSLLATLIIIIYALFSPIDSVSKTLILLLSFTTLLSIPQILQYDFVARAESKYPSLIAMTVTLSTSLLKVWLISTGKGIIYIALAMILEQIIYGILYISLYKFKGLGEFKKWSFSKNSASLMIKTGTAVAFLSLFSMIYSRIDQVMIRHFLDAEQLGFYSAGVRLVEIWGFLPTIILGGLYPALLNARKVSESLYVSRLRKTLILLLLPAIFASFVLFTFSFSLINTIFGPDFIYGASALKISAMCIPATYIGFFIMQTLYTDDYRKMLIVITLVPAIINIILNYFLIPIHGIIGASWATVIASYLLLLIPFVYKNTRDKFTKILFFSQDSRQV